MSLFNKKKTIVAHSGIFHPDDVFAVATLCLAHKSRPSDFTIIRTRDPKVIETGDFVVDVGGVHDETRDLFDHHQVGGAGKRPNGIPYAAFGLVWKKFGTDAVAAVVGGKAGKTKAGSDDAAILEVAGAVDLRLVSPLDSTDNGVAIVTATSVPDIFPYTLEDVVFSLLPNWDEKGVDIMEQFKKAVVLAMEVLTRQIKKTAGKYSAAALIDKAYESAQDKRLIVMDEGLPWKEAISGRIEPLMVIMPEADHASWRVHTVPLAELSFERRKLLPEAWAGKQGADLAAVTGVADAIFCHNGRFIAGARSKEGAIALAKLAL